MRRVSVVGSTGSGKTSFAAALAKKIAAPHIELDALNWEANWTMAPADVFRERIARATGTETWVVDGNYSGRGARDLVWRRADTVVWLDFPLRVILARLFRRAIRRIRTGAELWPGTGNRETVRNQFFSKETLFWFAVRTYRRRRREYEADLARPDFAHLEVHRFRRPGEAERWLSRI